MNPAKTPTTPYYAVIFTSIRMPSDNGYSDMSKKMVELASKQKGFLGMESARDDLGITVSYWDTLESIREWKENLFHKEAQNRAKDWYETFRVRVCLVEKEYGF